MNNRVSTQKGKMVTEQVIKTKIIQRTEDSERATRGWEDREAKVEEPELELEPKS